MVGDIVDLHVIGSSQWVMRGAQKYGSIHERNVFGTHVMCVSGIPEVAAVNDETTWAEFLGVSEVLPIPSAGRPIDSSPARQPVDSADAGPHDANIGSARAVDDSGSTV
ncbi:hypothetical protein JOE30_001587 [Rhodococcus sp. PvP016]|uniref:Uncharacterized protein n=1 Tax=Rhodococcoides corynebacterioides TaxID=53972 RepID=A0ABS2KMW7_9NOCA|nr:hypothetical protein [Rhodococcus corynebacterioides]MBP1115790.1 hypothetical protein [Rhodococcus sp. PvP016]